MGRTTSLTWGEYRTFWEEWSSRYLSDEGYWTIDDRPVCAFNNLADFVTRYGYATFAVMLRYGRRVAERATGKDPFLLGVVGQADLHNVRLANGLPIDGVTGYGLLPNWLGEPVQHYDDLIRARVADWDQVQERLSIPFFPVVCAGWDATMRGSFRGRLRSSDGYPYSPIVTGVTPKAFGRFLDLAIDFNQRWHPELPVVFLHAWNEWTESSVLEPSDRFGTALLDEVRARADAFVLQDASCLSAHASGATGVLPP